MSGKAKSNDKTFEAFQQTQNAKFENFMAQNTNIDHAQFFTAPPPQSNIKKFLELGLGNVMGGALGYNASVIEITSGAIDIGFGSGKFASHIIVEAEGGAGGTDFLTDIQNFVYSYQDLTIQAANGNIIIVETVGSLPSNIFLGQGVSSITLNPNEQLRLRYDIVAQRWTAFTGAAGGGAGGYNLIEDEGNPLTARTTMNFTGAGVTASDDGSKTVINIPGGTTTFPIRPDVLEIAGETTTNQSFDLATTTGHVLKLTAGGDFTITFTGFPTSDNIQQEWEVELTQNATGGHTITFASDAGTIVNPPVLNTTADSTTIIVFRTNDQGVTVRVGNTVTTTTGGATSFIGFSADDDLRMNTFDITQVDRLLFDQATGETLLATDIGITSDASGDLNFNSLDDYIFAIDGDPAVKIDDDGTGDLRLDMLKHSIVDAEDIKFDLTTTGLGVANTEAGIGADGTNSDLIFNVPTSAWQHIFTVNAVSKVTIGVSSTSLASGYRLILQPSAANAAFRVGAISANPTGVIGVSDMWFDTTLNQFRGKANTSIVTLGGDINVISQGDSSVTVLDAPGTITIKSNDTEVVNYQFVSPNNRAIFNDVQVSGITSFEFRDTVDASGATKLTQNQFDLTMNFPVDGDDFIITFGAGAAQGFIVDKDLTRVSSTSPNTIPTVFELFRNDPSPLLDDVVGIFKFRGENTASAVTTYAQIECQIIDPLSTNETSRLRWSIFDRNVFRDMMTLSPSNLTVRNFGITTEKVTLHLQKVDSGPSDAEPIANMDFEVLSGATTTTYVRLAGINNNNVDAGELSIQVAANNAALLEAINLRGDTNEDVVYMDVTNTQLVTDLKFGVEAGGAALQIRPIVNKLGIAVTTGTFTVGNSGTLCIPDQSTAPSANINAYDAAFGNKNGSIGIFSNGTGQIVSTLTWRHNGFWYEVSATPSIVT